MPANPVSRPLRLPPADLATRVLPRTRQPARSWFLIHAKQYSAIFFSINPAHRYSHADCPYQLLYVGPDLKTCLWERFGDHIYDHGYTIPRAQWDDAVISCIDVPPLRLCDLSRAPTRSALTVDLTALMNDDITVPQEWGLQIQKHPSEVPAIKFRSRFTNVACLAIFDRGTTKAQLKERLIGPLNQSDPSLDWLTQNEVTLL